MKKKHGFTLIEIIICIVLVSVIGAISFELYLAHIVPMNFLHNYQIMTALCIMIVGTIVLASLFHCLNIIVSKLK